jgi:hypothetical protein
MTKVQVAPRVAALFGLCLGLGSAQSMAQNFVGTAALPTGFGLYPNTVSISVSGSYGQWRDGVGSTRFDASTVLSYGLGDPVAGIGVQVDINVTSIRNLAASGYVSLTAHRMFQTSQAGVYSVAVNATHLAPWGNAARLDPGFSVIGSYLTGINGRLTVSSLGLTTTLNDARRIEMIAAFGMGLGDDWAVSLGWAGNQSVIGTTWQPVTLRGTTLGVSIRGIEDPARRLIGFDLFRSFNLARL